MDAPPADQFSIRELDRIEDGRRNRLCHRSTSRRLALPRLGTASATPPCSSNCIGSGRRDLLGLEIPDPGQGPTRCPLLPGLPGTFRHVAIRQLDGHRARTSHCFFSSQRGRRREDPPGLDQQPIVARDLGLRRWDQQDVGRALTVVRGARLLRGAHQWTKAENDVCLAVTSSKEWARCRSDGPVMSAGGRQSSTRSPSLDGVRRAVANPGG